MYIINNILILFVCKVIKKMLQSCYKPVKITLKAKEKKNLYLPHYY